LNRLHHGLIVLLLSGFWGGLPQPQNTPAVPGTPTQTPTFPPLPRPDRKNHPPVGQTLVYGAEWRVFNAGSATLRLEETARSGDAPEGHVLGTADAAGAVALLYHVHDRYDSFFNASSFCSKSISKRIEEGLRRVNADIKFDYRRGKAVLDQKNLKKGDSKHAEEDIPGCVTDVLSAFYYVGTLPLEPGKTFSFPLNDGGKTVTIAIHGEAKEQIKTPAGTFNTVRIQPDIPSGVLKGKGKIWIWYAEDLRMPVRLKGHLFWGTVTFTLQRFEKK
jgi:hypothetical protein